MTDVGDVCELSAKGYAEMFLTELRHLQQTGSLCDMRLSGMDGCVLAHRLVFMLASPYCKQRLQSDLTDVLHVDSGTIELLEMIVEFLYTGRVMVPMCELNQLSQVATDLMLHDLANLCQQQKTILQQTDKIRREVTVEDIDKGSEHSDAPCTKGMGSEKGNENNCALRNVAELGKRKSLETSVEPVRVKIPKSKTTGKRNRKVNNHEKKLSSKKMRTKSSKKKIKHKTCKISNGLNKNSNNRLDVSLEKLYGVSIKDNCNDDTSNDSKDAFKDDAENKTLKINTYIKAGQDKSIIQPVLQVFEKPSSISLIISRSQKTKFPFQKTCDTCNQDFVSRQSYKEHLRFHQANSSVDHGYKDRWPCTVCSRVLTSAVRLACHKNSKHGIPYDPHLKLHTCPHEGCTYITASKHANQIHAQGRHGNERPHVCEFCGKGFKLPSALTTHLNIHTNEKRYQCEQCSLTFNQKGGLNIHIKKHHMGQASWTELCHLCSVKFLHKADLCWHMYVVHQIPVPDQYTVFSCKLCDYQTLRKNKLERHIEAHNDTKNWVCDVCLKRFSSKSYLTRHRKYHGEKTCKCTFEGCSYATVDQVGLRKHIRLMHTHKDHKPFQCSLCQYKTGLRGNLDKHIRTVHNLDVVTKHTVHLKAKFKDLSSGDILTKDGQLLHNVQETTAWRALTVQWLVTVRRRRGVAVTMATKGDLHFSPMAPSLASIRIMERQTGTSRSVDQTPVCSNQPGTSHCNPSDSRERGYIPNYMFTVAGSPQVPFSTNPVIMTTMTSSKADEFMDSC